MLGTVHKPLYIAIIDLMKAFDFVSRDGLLKISEENRMSTNTSQYNIILPQKHPQHNQLWLYLIPALQDC